MTRGSQFEKYRLIGSFVANGIKREIWVEVLQLQIAIHQPGLKHFVQVMRAGDFKRAYSRNVYADLELTEFGIGFLSQD